MTVDVLLDSTYILPSFGVEVEGFSVNHIAELREAGVGGRVRFHCLSVIWIEVLGKVCREKERLGMDVDEVIELAVKSLLESGFYKWITPTADDVKLAFKLRSLGHKDNIDNLLYAASVNSNMILLTMDEKLKKFLIQKNFKVDNLANHEDLLEMVKGEDNRERASYGAH